MARNNDATREEAIEEGRMASPAESDVQRLYRFYAQQYSLPVLIISALHIAIFIMVGARRRGARRFARGALTAARRSGG